MLEMEWVLIQDRVEEAEQVGADFRAARPGVEPYHS